MDNRPVVGQPKAGIQHNVAVDILDQVVGQLHLSRGSVVVALIQNVAEKADWNCRTKT